jgi:hypothetical protein
VAGPVFISYRRKAGNELAQLVNAELVRRKCATHLDVEHQEPGKFWEQLQATIRSCRAFVLICTTESFAAAHAGEDWVVREVAEALASGRLIVPVFSKGFVPPPNLSGPLADALQYNGISMDTQFPAAAFDRLAELVGGRRSIRGTRLVLVTTAVIILSAAVAWRLVKVPAPVGPAPAVAILDRAWPIGSHLKVTFENGTRAQRQKVTEVAKTWLYFANLYFDFMDAGPSDVRIAFALQGPSWSFRGTESRDIPAQCPTMTLSMVEDSITITAFDRANILHEFGHVLGFLDEIQNPNGHIPWTKAVRDAGVEYQYVTNSRECRAPFNKPVTYQEQLPNYREFDPHSIMMAPIDPQYLTDSSLSLGSKLELSESDEQFASKLYPRTPRSR